MQEEAAERVREMKKRASIVVEEDEKRKNPPPKEVRHISYPVEIEQPTKPQPEKAPSSGEKKPHTGLIKLLTEDKDTLLILAVLAVVSQNDNDYMTSLALLYLLL